MRWTGTDTGTDPLADAEIQAAADASRPAVPAAAPVNAAPVNAAPVNLVQLLPANVARTPRPPQSTVPATDPVDADGPRRPALESPDNHSNGNGGKDSAVVVAPVPRPPAEGVAKQVRHWVSERTHVVVIAGLAVVTSLATALVVAEGARQLTTPGRDTTPYLVTGPRGPVRLPMMELPRRVPRGDAATSSDRDRTVRRQSGESEPEVDRGSRRNPDVDRARRDRIPGDSLRPGRSPGRSPESGRTPPRNDRRDKWCRGPAPDTAGCSNGNTRGTNDGTDVVREIAPLDVTDVPVTSLGLLPVG